MLFSSYLCVCVFPLLPNEHEPFGHHSYKQLASNLIKCKRTMEFEQW